VPASLNHLSSPCPMPDERRAARRAILPGMRATFESAEGLQQEADVTNVGQGGLFLQTDSPVPAGKRLSLDIHVVGQPAPWSALGRVAWARWLADDEGPAGMGVKLIDVEDDVAAAIEAMVERLSPPEPPPVVPDAPPSRSRVPGAWTLPPPSPRIVEPAPYPNQAAVEQDIPTLTELAEPNVAIDLVQRKSEPSFPMGEKRQSETWDDDFSLPKRRLGRWLVLGLLLVGVGCGFVWRARLLAQWSQLER
jgi:uncharacterized protein (TIGR02266 family)